LIAFLLSHRATSLSLILLVTVFSLWFTLTLRIDPGAESVLPVGGRELKDLKEFHATFGADEVIVLALHSPRLFTDETLARMQVLTDQAARLPHVSRVLSPTNARDLDGDELGPIPLTPYDKVLQGEWSAEEMGHRLASHPLFGGLLVSENATTAAILIELEQSQTDSDYRGRLVAQVRELAAGAGPGIEAHVAGIPVEKVDVAAYVRRDQGIFIPLIFGLLALVTLALYRHPSGMMIPLGVVSLSLLWTMGLYGAAGHSLNPVTSLITPVVLVVSVAGAIHLLNHHLAGRASGLSRNDALQHAFQASSVPCFNAALTTAIGFGSLLMLPIPAIRDFGIFTAAGVMISYLLTMTLAPLLIAVLPDFPPRVTRAFRRGPVEQSLRRITGSICRHPVASAFGVLVVLAVSVAGVWRIRVETDLLHSLRSDSPLAVATEFIDHHLTGVNSLEILVHGVSVENAEDLRKMARFEEEIRLLPGIRKIAGYPDLAARVNRALHQGQDSFGRLPEGPDSGDDLAAIQDLLNAEAPVDLHRFLSPDGRTLRLAARAAALNTGESQRLFAQIRRAAAQTGLGKVTLTGNFAVLSDLSTSLVSNQMKGLVPALLLILLAMMIQFRSVRLGLLSAIPTAAPVLMTYGLMGWIGIPLSVPTAMIASIAMGMTDDNTIHLLARFREEFKRDGDYEIALEAMMDTSGRAVLFSTLTVAIGFWVGAFSSFLPSRHFALLTGATLLLGLLCEAVLLPLSLVLFKPLGKPGTALEVPRTRAAFLMAVAAACLIVQASRPLSAATSDLKLKDQYGREDGPALHRGAPLLLIYGRPPDLRRMKTWEVKVKEKAGKEIQVLRAVDARTVQGKKTEAQVNERLQSMVPKEIAILVDWNGELAKSLSLSGEEVSASLLDPKGKVCCTVVGPAQDAPLNQVLETLASVRAKGSCP
jgi:hydrophobe/amphiphile efflux-3 (HAE3) family protein